MNRTKKTIIIALLALVVCIGIGFAAFSTTLKINGSAKVSPNANNYKVLFASSVTSVSEYSTDDFDGTPVPSTLEASQGTFTEDTTFTNDGVTFTEDGQSIEYKFYILNAGKYDANINTLDIGSKTCTPGEDADPALAASACNSINLSVILGDPGKEVTYTSSQEIENHVLKKREWEQIIVRITYPEGSPLVDGELDVKWENVSFHTSSAQEAPVPEPTPTDSVIKILSGDIDTIGSEVAIGDEEFYVIPNRDGNDTNHVSLFSKYNLLVGKDYENDGSTTTHIYTSEDEGYGLQNSQAIGISFNTGKSYSTVAFNDTELTPVEEIKYIYNNTYTISQYIDNYVDYLNGLVEKGGLTGELIGLNQIEGLECENLSDEEIGYSGYCENSKYPFVKSTSYWSGVGLDPTNDNDSFEYVYIMLSTPSWDDYGGFNFGYGSASPDMDFVAGVRPVIVVPKDYFEE